MLAVFGLGNPGTEYQKTRHNIGFEVIDAIAGQFHIALAPGHGDYWFAVDPHEPADFILVKPTTYMNNSGIAVKEVIDLYHLSADQVFVVLDDFHLPLGTIRIRRAGSSGGHNGLASVIYSLESEDFPRMRIGIGNSTLPTEKSERTGFVLSPFTPDERSPVLQSILQARDAVVTAAREGLEVAIRRFNRSQV